MAHGHMSTDFMFDTFLSMSNEKQRELSQPRVEPRGPQNRELSKTGAGRERLGSGMAPGCFRKPARHTACDAGNVWWEPAFGKSLQNADCIGCRRGTPTLSSQVFRPELRIRPTTPTINRIPGGPEEMTAMHPASANNRWFRKRQRHKSSLRFLKAARRLGVLYAAPLNPEPEVR